MLFQLATNFILSLSRIILQFLTPEELPFCFWIELKQQSRIFTIQLTNTKKRARCDNNRFPDPSQFILTYSTFFFCVWIVWKSHSYNYQQTKPHLDINSCSRGIVYLLLKKRQAIDGVKIVWKRLLWQHSQSHLDWNWSLDTYRSSVKKTNKIKNNRWYPKKYKSTTSVWPSVTEIYDICGKRQ